jgi:hypothetical protein
VFSGRIESSIGVFEMAKKNAKVTRKPNTFGLELVTDGAIGGANRYTVKSGDAAIPLTRFLRVLGANGWGFKQTESLLADLGLPIVPPATREDIAAGNYAKGTTANTVRSQLHSGRSHAKGRSGEQVHHGVPKESDTTAFGSIIKKAVSHYCEKAGTAGYIAPAQLAPAKPKRKGK